MISVCASGFGSISNKGAEDGKTLAGRGSLNPARPGRESRGRTFGTVLVESDRRAP